MNHRGIKILKAFKDEYDCRPPKANEGTQWISIVKGIHVGFKYETADDIVYYDTVQEVKDAIDRILNAMILPPNPVTEKEAVRLFKEN